MISQQPSSSALFSAIICLIRSRAGIANTVLAGWLLICCEVNSYEANSTVTFEVSAFANLFQRTMSDSKTERSIDPIKAPICEIGPNELLTVYANGCVVDRGINCTDASGESSVCPDGEIPLFRELPVCSLIARWSTQPDRLDSSTAIGIPFVLGKNATITLPKSPGVYYLFLGDNDGMVDDNSDRLAEVLPYPAIAANPAATVEPEIYFAEDVSPHLAAPLGPNQVARRSILNSRRTAELFHARLRGLRTEDFEGFAAESVPTQLKFGATLVTLDGSQSVQEVVDPAGTAQGQFPISGTRGLNMGGTDGSGLASLDFSAPQSAFGFFATDIELNGLALTLVGTDDTRREFTVPVTHPQGSGGVLFFGVIDRQNPFVRVELNRVGNFEDGFLFDDLVIATPEEVLPDFDWPTVSIADASVTEGNTGTSEIRITASLSRAPAGVVTVEFFTTDGTALAGSDYAATNGILTLQPGQTNAIIVVRVNGDQEGEPDETFHIQLRNPTGLLLGIGEGTGTIANDDKATPPRIPPTVSVTDPQPNAIFLPDRERTPMSADIDLAATAADVDGRVVKVAFFADSRLIGEASTFPYHLRWLNAPVGGHLITACATDDDGLSTNSEAIPVTVVDLSGEVAIVGGGDDPEVRVMIEALSQIGIWYVRLDRSRATTEILRNFKAVVWDTKSLESTTPDEIERLESLAASPGGPVSFYFLGSNLFDALTKLDADRQKRWLSLLNLSPVGGMVDSGPVVFDSTEEKRVVNGVVGVVGPAQLTPPLPLARAADGTSTIGKRGVAPAMVLSSAEPQRTATQLFSLVSETGSLDSRERQRLFQNAIWWLLRKPLCPFPLLIEAIPIAEAKLPGGAVDYLVKMRRLGDCSIAGSSFVLKTDPRIRVVGVRPSVGRWEATPDGGVLRLGSAVGDLREASICVVLDASEDKTFTNRFEAHIFSADETLGDDQRKDEVTTISSIESADLVLEQSADGSADLVLMNPEAGESYQIESSNDLRTWTIVESLAHPGWRKTVSAAALRPGTGFYRITWPLPCR